MPIIVENKLRWGGVGDSSIRYRFLQQALAHIHRDNHNFIAFPGVQIPELSVQHLLFSDV